MTEIIDLAAARVKRVEANKPIIAQVGSIEEAQQKFVGKTFGATVKISEIVPYSDGIGKLHILFPGDEADASLYGRHVYVRIDRHKKIVNIFALENHNDQAS